MNVAAATGPMTGKNTLTNSPSEPHLKAFRVDLRCSGMPSVSPMSKVCRGHNDRAKACCGTYCTGNARIECGGVSCQLSHVRGRGSKVVLLGLEAYKMVVYAIDGIVVSRFLCK